VVAGTIEKRLLVLTRRPQNLSCGGGLTLQLSEGSVLHKMLMGSTWDFMTSGDPKKIRVSTLQ